ncbi:MAG: Uma2 family endonuclease [Vulcanimicrobiota bacterium]
MAEVATQYEEIPEPDISHLVTEDDEPVDNLYSERQQALLADALNVSWNPDREFLTMVNVGLFYSLQSPPYVPDFLLSMDVKAPPDVWEKKHRSYFIWQYGKRPDLVVEVVSNIDRHEERKIEGYAQIGIPYYVIHDPEHRLSERTLRAFELHGSRYVELVKPWFVDLEIGLALWKGEYRGIEESWLRWCDRQGTPLLTGAERADQESERADQERERADQERERADQERERAYQERERAALLEAKLRELGIDPESV